MSAPILPGAILGILGGGHAGRMTALAAHALGYRVHALDTDPAATSGPVVERVVRGAPDDPAAVVDASRVCDVATSVVEQIEPDALWRAALSGPVRPSPGVVALTRDRHAEHRWLHDRGFLVAPWRAAGTPEELAAAVGELGGACWVKPRVRQSDEARPVRVASPADALAAWTALAGRPCVAERELDVDLELSVLVARAPGGELATYPSALSARQAGELLWSALPAPVPAALTDKAEQLAAFIARKLKVEGLVTVELFLLRDGRLFVNELVATPHATYLGAELACATGQWEQLVRAICDLPLGETRVVRPVASAVIWGDWWTAGVAPRFDRALRAPGVTLRLYDKGTPEPGRKMGHLLAVGDTVEEAIGRVTYAAAQLGSWPAAAGRGVARARPAAGDDRARSGIEASGAPTPPSAGGRWPQSVMRRAGTLACTLLAASACAPGGYEARWVGRGYHVHPAPALDLAPPRVRPLVVGITGPAEVATPGRQWFRAHASGGLGEYRYAWEVAGDTDHFRPTGVTGPVLVRQVGSGDVVRLRVTVTSGAQHATAVRRVEGPPPAIAD